MPCCRDRHLKQRWPVSRGGWCRWRSPVVEIYREVWLPGCSCGRPPEGNWLLRIMRRTSGSVVTWQRAQIVLLSAQGMSRPAVSEVACTDPDTVWDVIKQLNADGFDALY